MFFKKNYLIQFGEETCLSITRKNLCYSLVMERGYV